MLITSRNINGVRAWVKNGCLDDICQIQPDILCLQEVKAYKEQIPQKFNDIFKDYSCFWNAAQKPWYAWTAILYRNWLNVSVIKKLDISSFFEKDGRLIELQFVHNWQNYALINWYFPNGNPRSNWQEILPHKLTFYQKYTEYIATLQNQWNRVICAWDFNVAHKDIDVYNPSSKRKAIWFLPCEKKKLDALIRAWFVDVYRYFYPEKEWSYTWRSWRKGVKENNRGWRYDYFFVDTDSINFIENCIHHTTIRSSDHCPISLRLKNPAS